MKHLLLALGLILSVCAYQQSFAQGVLTVVDGSHNPVSNASILIGMAPGNPFSGNQLSTNASGQITFPPQFTSAMPVTVSAPGFITETYMSFSPTSQSIQLSAQELETPAEVQGNTSGYTGVVNGDGLIDFGLIFQVISPTNWLGFDLTQIVSPNNTTLSVLGQSFSIPSNIALPNQSETYIVAPVTLNSPSYAAYLRYEGATHLTAMHGRFPLKQVIGDIRGGKTLIDEINYFTFVGVGGSDMTVTGPMTGQNLTMDQMMTPNTVPVTAPTLAAGQVVLAMAVAQTPAGDYYATDLKQLGSGQSINLATSTSATGTGLFSILLPTSLDTPGAAHPLAANDLLNVGKQLRAMFSPLVTTTTGLMEQQSMVFQKTAGTTPAFLPLLAAPTVNGSQIQVQPPTLPAGLQAVGTYVVYADLLAEPGSSINGQQRTRLWEVWQNGFVGTLNLPTVNFTTPSGHTNRWEVYFLANETTQQTPAQGSGAIDVTTVTHATKTSLDVQ